MYIYIHTCKHSFIKPKMGLKPYIQILNVYMYTYMHTHTQT